MIGKEIFVIKKTKQHSDQIYFDTNVIKQGKNSYFKKPDNIKIRYAIVEKEAR